MRRFIIIGDMAVAIREANFVRKAQGQNTRFVETLIHHQDGDRTLIVRRRGPIIVHTSYETRESSFFHDSHTGDFLRTKWGIDNDRKMTRRIEWFGGLAHKFRSDEQRAAYKSRVIANFA